ncbi:MAG: NFACT family protein, partial [Firmicutes bacterium]|nr:NFACT family protein [Bacillota bacterium]
MAFDGIVMRALARELKTRLEGGRIDKIHQPENDQLVFTVNAGREKLRLFVSSDGNAPRAYLTAADYVNPQNPMPFCMLLRKHMQNSRIREIRQVGSERILEFYVDSVTELGYAVSHKLVFECMGKHSNILLVN